MKLDHLRPTDSTSFLLKGPPGFGKTIAAASFAKGGTVFLSYWDKKAPIELLMFFKRYAPELLKNIEYEVYGAQNANEYLNKLFSLAKDCRYFAVINDSLTSMTSGTVNWSLGFRDAKKKDEKKDRIIPGFDEYKAETSIVTQALDICTALPCHVLWTAHPLPQIKIDDVGDGKVGKISKTNSLVTYGNKVAGLVPGRFSEIYQFSKRTDWSGGRSRATYFVATDAVGDEYAKSNIGLNTEFEITNRLFYDVWKEEIQKFEERIKEEQKAGIQEAPAGAAPVSTQFVSPFEPKNTKKEPFNPTPWKPA